MADLTGAERAFRAVRDQFVVTGRAPHYTELAAILDCSIDEARQALHDLMEQTAYPGWLYPNTDYITSFAPFHNLPTQYQILIDGRPHAFAQ